MKYPAVSIVPSYLCETAIDDAMAAAGDCKPTLLIVEPSDEHVAAALAEQYGLDVVVLPSLDQHAWALLFEYEVVVISEGV